MRLFRVLLVLLVAGPPLITSATPAAASGTLDLRFVTPSALEGWTLSGGSELAPWAAAHTGVGAVVMRTGGAPAADLLMSHPALAGTAVGGLRFFAYDAYVASQTTPHQAPRAELHVDRVPGGSEPEDVLVLEPAEAVADDGSTFVTGRWQAWAAGTITSTKLYSTATGVTSTIGEYAAAHPGAVFSSGPDALPIHGRGPGLVAAVERVSVRLDTSVLQQWRFDPEVRVVDDANSSSGESPVCSDPAYPAFASPQAAVDSATPGSTVYLCSGTFAETITLTKSLTIVGPEDPSRFGRLPERASVRGVIVGDGGDDVVLEGFTMQDRSAGAGLEFSGGGTLEVRGARVTNNAGGILLNDAVATIAGTAITGNSLPGTMSNVGIASIGPLSGSISDNDIGGQTAASITVGGPSSGLVIERNRTTGGRGIALVNAVNASLVGNDISNPSGAGILIAGSNTNTLVSGNRVHSASAAGVRVSHVNTGVRVVSNDLHANNSGVKVARKGGVVELKYNRLVGNVGTGITYDGTTVLVAEHNWWGCNSGAGAAPCQRLNSPGPVDVSPPLLLRALPGDRIGDPASSTSTPVSAKFEVSGAPILGTYAAVADGILATFSTTAGELESSQARTFRGEATTYLRRNAPHPAATVSVTVDAQTVSVNLSA